MKWFKKGKTSTPVSSDQSISFEFYEDQRIVDREMEIKRPDGSEGRRSNDPNPDLKQRHLWAHYPLGKEMGPLEQRDYEIFCGGYLVYHERNINRKTEYKIYFEWSLKGHIKPFSVSIYLSPPPVKKDIDTSPKMQSQSQANTDNTGLEGMSEPDSPIAFAPAPPPDANAFQSIDPPKPPPPPPPPRD